MPAGTDAAQWYGNEIAVGALVVSTIAAFVNALIAFYAVRQSRIAKTATDALLRGERAWLIVNLEQVTKESLLTALKEGEQAIRRLKLAIKNVGRTPARIQTISARAILIEYGSAARGEWTDAPKESWFDRLLVPTDSAPHFTVIETDYSIVDLMSRMQDGELTFIVFGEVNYSDVYDYRHTTRFRIRRRLKWTSGLDSMTIQDSFAEPEFNAAS